MNFEQQLHAELEEFEPITGAIADAQLREEIVHLLTAEILARLALGEIHLEPYEQPDYEEPEIDMWEQLAQPVRSALVSLHELKSALLEFSPATIQVDFDDDIMFDLVDGAPSVERLRDSLGEQVDAWLETVGAEKAHKTPQEQRTEVLDAIAPLADIILQEINRFGQRLRNPHVVGDRWNLLADLQELKGKFQKLLRAMRFGLLKPFTDLSEDLLLKEYRTEREAAQLLRRGVVMLTRDVAMMVASYHAGNIEERRFILEELLVRLMRFSRSDTFTLLRAPDKRVLIEFRKDLARNVSTMRERSRVIDELLEGFGKFLEVLGDINRREVLVTHDRALVVDMRQRLLAIEEVSTLDVASALALFGELRGQALPMYGRESMLDDWLDATTPPDDRDDLRAQLAWLNRALLRVRL